MGEYRGRIRVGVIGTGAMGLAHVDTLTRWVPAAEVTAVHDLDARRAKKVADGVGASPLDSAEAVIEAVDAVVIASPDATHEELALACIVAGRPVLCEKPLAVTAEGSARVVAAEESAGSHLVQVGFMRRYDPALVCLRDAVRAGSIGRPRVVHCLHRNPTAHPTATSEGIIANSMVHELDMVPWLLNDPITAITVITPQLSGLRDPQVALLETGTGVLCTAEVFVNARYGYDVQCEVVGDAGTVRLTPPYGLAYRRAGTDGVEVTEDFVARFADAYRIELATWVEAVRRGDGVAPGAPAALDGHRAAVVAQAGVESLRIGTRVEVPPT